MTSVPLDSSAKHDVDDRLVGLLRRWGISRERTTRTASAEAGSTSPSSREVLGSFQDFPHEELFQDRFVCAVDAANDAVGSSISLEEFSAMPYLATSCGHEVSPAEAQLDMPGISRNTEVTTAFGLAPLLLAGTRRIALIHERLAIQLAGQTSLRLLEPPMALQPITQLMLWSLPGSRPTLATSGSAAGSPPSPSSATPSPRQRRGSRGHRRASRPCSPSCGPGRARSLERGNRRRSLWPEAR